MACCIWGMHCGKVELARKFNWFEFIEEEDVIGLCCFLMMK